jgi:GrpB-like predicted nucleotidyltransferase (UPF0157 family)
MPRPIILVPYQERWPEQFRQLRGQLDDALGLLSERIEHVGSTAVPGLWAKPIIDIDIVISAETAFGLIQSSLAGIGYDHLGDQGITGRDAFDLRRSETNVPEHHLYVCRANSIELRRHIAFRDYLLTHPDRAKEYSRLKRNLAARYRNDRNAYTDAKDEFIVTVLNDASAAN